MNAALKVGTVHELRFTVPASKAVPALYPESDEFRLMPRVFATGYLVGLLEWCCIRLVKPYLDWPREQTVGTHIDVSHAAATPPGLEVLARATLVEIDGRRLRFEVEAHDGFDVISRGGHERFIIDRARFAERLDRKLSAVSS